MPKYITRPVKSNYYDDEVMVLPSTITVYEGESAPVETALYDHHGDKIYRASDRIPIGFKVK